MKTGYCWECGSHLKFDRISWRDSSLGLYCCEKDKLHYYPIPLKYLNPELLDKADVERNKTVYNCYNCGNHKFGLLRRIDDPDLFESRCLECGQSFIFHYLGFFLEGVKVR